MIHAYDKIYLDKARIALGRMLDFAAYDLNYDIAVFFELFIESGIAERFEIGDFAVTVGMSGVELAYKVLECSGVEGKQIKPNYTMDRSEEFWLGFVRNCECTLHINQLAGVNTHHIIEGAFKSVARSLRKAAAIDEMAKDEIPSTKGVL